MALTLASWNLKTPGGAKHANLPLPEKRLELIGRCLESTPAILGLQEVTPGFARSLADVRCSLEQRPAGEFDGGMRMLGVGLLVSPEIEVVRWGLIERAPFPERTLVADVVVGGRPIHVVVFHSLTGVDYRRAKAAQFKSIAEHLVGIDGDTVLVGDANEPEVDARDPRKIACWKRNGKGAELLFGPEPVHGLKDAWRAFLGPRVNDAPPRGPLAVSHRTRGNPRRYDHIYVPGSWAVTDMQYRYDEGIGAGSDHALVTATVHLA